MALRQQDFLLDVLLEDEEAVAFCQLVGGLSHVIDDLVDESKTSPSIVIRAFYKALFTLPNNPFYARHRFLLEPVLHSAYLSWVDSVALESRKTEHAVTLAYFLRDKLTDVVVQCAYIVGGFEHGVKVGPSIRTYFLDEPLADFIKEHCDG